MVIRLPRLQAQGNAYARERGGGGGHMYVLRRAYPAKAKLKLKLKYVIADCIPHLANILQHHFRASLRQCRGREKMKLLTLGGIR